MSSPVDEAFTRPSDFINRTADVHCIVLRVIVATAAEAPIGPATTEATR